jgi:acyl-CoA dehydrogenase
MSITLATIAAEELGRADISLALPVMYLVQASWGLIFDRNASSELKKEILPRVTAGKAFLGIATTEPGGGSDIEGATRCKAERAADGWLLNGEKMYISGIKEELAMGGIHMTLVRTDPAARHRGFTFFAVPLKDNPHVTTTLVEDWGRQGISTGGFNMENLPLPDKNRIGDVNRGFYYAMEGFTLARILIGATCVGAAEAGLQMGVDYIKQRKAFGKPLAAYQGVSFPAAERFTDIETARRVIIEAVEKLEGVLPDKPVEALYIEMGASAMIFRVRWWIESYVDTRRIIDRVHTALQYALDEAGIESPFPTQNVNLQVETLGLEHTARSTSRVDDRLDMASAP